MDTSGGQYTVTESRLRGGEDQAVSCSADNKPSSRPVRSSSSALRRETCVFAGEGQPHTRFLSVRGALTL